MQVTLRNSWDSNSNNHLTNMTSSYNGTIQSLVPAASLEHFKSSWTASVIDDMLKSGFTVKKTPSREVKADGEDSLFGQTFRSAKTIPHVMNFWRKPDNDYGEMRMLMSLGSGLNGHADILHGGFTATLIDESCGFANMYWSRSHTFTANLNVNYRKPIPTPSIVLARAWITKVDGRKRWVKCELLGEHAVLYAEAETLFLEFKDVPAKL